MSRLTDTFTSPVKALLQCALFAVCIRQVTNVHRRGAVIFRYILNLPETLPRVLHKKKET